MNDGSAPVLYWRYYLNRPRGLKETHDHDQARARPFRAFSHRQAAHRRRSHRHLQLGLRPGYRRHLRAAHRGHRPGAFHRGEHPDHSARAEVDGPRLGRGPGGGRTLRPLLPDPAHRHVRGSAAEAHRRRRRLSLLLHQGGAGRQARGRRENRGRLRGLRSHLSRHSSRRGRRARCSWRAPCLAPESARRPRSGHVQRCRLRRHELPHRCDGRHDSAPHRRHVHLQLRCGLRRCEHGHHPRHPRRRPSLQHPAPGAHLRGARRRGAAVRAPVHDLGPRRQEALEAPRRHQRGGVPRPGVSARCPRELPGAARLVARRRDHHYPAG